MQHAYIGVPTFCRCLCLSLLSMYLAFGYRCLFMLLLGGHFAVAQIVHFSTTNGDAATAGATGEGAAWLISIRGAAGTVPTREDMSALHDAIVLPATVDGGVCALSGSFTSRAVRLALLCPADATVVVALVEAIRTRYPSAAVAYEPNAEVGVYAAALPRKPTAATAAVVSPETTELNPAYARGAATQVNVRWGLDRIDMRGPSYDNRYIYDDDGGGTDIWIVDTGVRTTHSEFSGRAFWRANTKDNFDSDCNGHGTHVAGVAAGTIYGVAKEAQIHAIKVLDCAGMGTTFDVIAGLDFVAENRSPTRATVINLSLNAAKSPALEERITSLVRDDGIAVVVAAGNSRDDACSYSPSGSQAPLVVAASTDNDQLASFSNDGPCVDIAAPGVDIISAWGSGDTAFATLDGTSFAAPHVSGAVAMLWSLQRNKRDATSVMTTLVARGTPGVLRGGRRSSVPPLLYTRLATVAPPRPPVPPRPALPPPPANAMAGHADLAGIYGESPVGMMVSAALLIAWLWLF